MYSVIFCGTPAFACPSLQALYDDPAFTVTTVITQPNRPVGRKQIMISPAVKVLAEELNIPVMQPEDINALSVPEVLPDFLVVVAYGQIFSKNILSIPKIMPINVHASLLPHLRGASPIQHSILQGDTETGITIQHMAEKLDSGPILAQEKIRIDPRETAEMLTERLSTIGARVLIKTLKKPLKETPQEESKAIMCGKLKRSMGDVDPTTMTAEEIDRRVRALVPWPGVRMNKKHVILSGDQASNPDAMIGVEGRLSDQVPSIKIIATSLCEDANAFAIPCAGNSQLYILKLQAPGKNVVTGAEWGRNKA